MSYADFKSPQFVDFTSIDTFDINDGADNLFEEYVMGEGVEIGRLSANNEAQLLNDITKMVVSNQNDAHAKVEVDKENTLAPSLHHSTTSKSNQESVAHDIVGTTAPSVGSAIDMVKTSTSQQHNARPPLVLKSSNNCESTSIAASGSQKQRTLSTSAAIGPPSLLINKPVQPHLPPAHNGLKWIPKTGASTSSTANKSKPLLALPPLPLGSAATTSSDSSHAHHRVMPDTNSYHTKPIIVADSERKPMAGSASSLTRSTPGKSASMRGEKRPNLIKSFLMKPKLPTAFSSASSKPPVAAVTATTTPSSTSAAHQTPSMSSSILHNHARKVSESSKIPLPIGPLHTEMRAQKRMEFEQVMREKERLAAQQRLALEQERQRQEQEIVQRLRSTSTFRSQPIKHYKPVEIKPSEKPLTSPKSPHLATLTCHHHNYSMSKKTSSSNASYVKAESSQEDLKN